MKKSIYIKQLDSTNELLWNMLKEYELPEGFVVYTDYQTAGKGQKGNSWESDNRKNLLFSLVLYPKHISVNDQFLISQLVSLGIKNSLEAYTAGISIKWPNDLYWNDRKIGGILIENSLQGDEIKSVVVGIGLNINQKKFVSNAPNPVSLLQITGKKMARKRLLKDIVENIMKLYNDLKVDEVRTLYKASLYRKNGYHDFRTKDKLFRARIVDVDSDGRLLLETETGDRCGYYFKEVQFVI